MDFKVVADSSADLTSFSGVPFACAPLKIVTAQKEYSDDASLDVDKMVDELAQYRGKSHTSCPSPADWEDAFADAENVFCVSITSALSGSFNAAQTAKRDYEEAHPNRKVFVIDSLSAGPELRLIIEKLKEHIDLGKTFEEICSAITEYTQRTGLLFMLASMNNLANNGRVNPFVARAAGLLGIRVVGKASDKGELDTLEKCRGEKRALSCVIEHMRSLGHRGGKVRIGHILNENAARVLKDMILSEFSNTDVEIYRSRGLCSFYAEKGGLMIGYEKANIVGC